MYVIGQSAIGLLKSIGYKK